jgi:hypothetical protein
LYGKEHYKEILFTNEKHFYCGELSISKTMEFMHDHLKKPTNWCHGSNFCEKGIKTAGDIISGTF